jgi:hypothetical protein
MSESIRQVLREHILEADKQEFAVMTFKGTKKTIVGSSDRVDGAIQLADRKVPEKYTDIVIRSDYTSDGTKQGKGKGKLVADRRNGKWTRY